MSIGARPNVDLVKDDGTVRTVTAAATIDGVQRSLQIEFQALPPGPFENTMATCGDITLDGNLGVMQVHGKTRTCGTYIDSGRNLQILKSDSRSI